MKFYLYEKERWGGGKGFSHAQGGGAQKRFWVVFMW